MSQPTVAGLITAAGSSRRMGGTKKEYMEWQGMSFLEHTVKAFIESGVCLFITLIHPEDHPPLLDKIRGLYPDYPLYLCGGGATRQESVFRGLQSLKTQNPDLVLIHDGARPWVTGDLIRKTAKETSLHGAAVPLLLATYAMKVWNDDGFITDHVDRARLAAAQTPQGFSFMQILKAHEKAAGSVKPYVDDSEIYHDFIGPVKGIEGEPSNIKITYREDLPK